MDFLTCDTWSEREISFVLVKPDCPEYRLESIEGVVSNCFGVY